MFCIFIKILKRISQIINKSKIWYKKNILCVDTYSKLVVAMKGEGRLPHTKVMPEDQG